MLKGTHSMPNRHAEETIISCDGVDSPVHRGLRTQPCVHDNANKSCTEARMHPRRRGGGGRRGQTPAVNQYPCTMDSHRNKCTTSARLQSKEECAMYLDLIIGEGLAAEAHHLELPQNEADV